MGPRAGEIQKCKIEKLHPPPHYSPSGTSSPWPGRWRSDRQRLPDLAPTNALQLCHTLIAPHKYTNTGTHTYTNTHIHKHTHTQIQIHRHAKKAQIQPIQCHSAILYLIGLEHPNRIHLIAKSSKGSSCILNHSDLCCSIHQEGLNFWWPVTWPFSLVSG